MTPADLAILGAEPKFQKPVHVGRPNLGSRERLRQRFEDILDSRWLTNGGPYVQEFEARLREMTRARHAIAVCNATVALELASRALGMSGEVIAPSFTFVATVHALSWQGMRPVFADIERDSHNLDPSQVDERITERTTGIVATHLWGRVCETEALEKIARRRGLKLLFDAAHAFGAKQGGRPVGTFGDAEVFSFHATKFVNAFEGGAITTNDDALARRIRLMKNFGFDGYDSVVHPGTNGKMSEICAAMGVTSLEAMPEIVEANRRNLLAYRNGLNGLRGLRFLPEPQGQESNDQYVVLEVEGEEAGLSRDELTEVLWRENVRARRYFYPGAHRMEPYKSQDPIAGSKLPVTELVVERVLVLPTGTGLSEDDVTGITRLIRVACERAEEVSAALRKAGCPPAWSWSTR